MKGLVLLPFERRGNEKQRSCRGQGAKRHGTIISGRYNADRFDVPVKLC